MRRERELAAIGQALAGAAEGVGKALIVRGPAGIGKTSLLDQAAARAKAGGFRVLRARGSELERDFSLGLLRQLFERKVARASAAERRRLLAGPALVAAAALGLSEAAAPIDTFSVLHGFYWLCANLAEGSAVALVVDDVQWADEVSARWLSYMLPRLDDLSVVAAVGLRAEAERARVTAATLGDVDEATVLEPSPLDRDAVSQLVRIDYDRDASEVFCAACHGASGGNPFYLQALIDELPRAAISADDESAPRVGELTPETISRSVVGRITRLPPHCAEVVGALETLGDGAEVRHVAALANVDVEAAQTCMDDLREVGIVDSGATPAFAHPLVRAAIAAEVPAGLRSLRHSAAAEMLAADGVATDRLALHLFEVTPTGDQQIVSWLRDAAATAIASGAPGSAVASLRRALAEPPDEGGLSTVLLELGRAEVIARDPDALAHLQAATETARDPAARVDAACSWMDALGFAGQLEEADGVAARTLASLNGGAASLEARIAVTSLSWSLYGGDKRGISARRELERMAETADETTPAGRQIIFNRAQQVAATEGNRAACTHLLDRGLGNVGLTPVDIEGAAAGQALFALCFVDELGRAEALVEAIQADGRRRGSIVAAVTAPTLRGYISLRRGGVGQAVADGEAALALALEHGLLFIEPFARALLSSALIERGQAEGAAELLPTEVMTLPPFVPSAGFLLDALGRARIARGDVEGGGRFIRQLGELWSAADIRSPNVIPWRSTLALTLGPEHQDEAIGLVDAELSAARASGLPRGIGVALRAQGLLSDEPQRTELLHEAVTHLEASPSRLELARALTDLGAALRRSNRRADARAPLVRAVELAATCGAAPITKRAEEELLAAGGRPPAGQDDRSYDLTPAERRVAIMAADGLSNREIAQALFVSTKTVEMHLGRTYRKLGIHSRGKLQHFLDRTDDVVAA